MSLATDPLLAAVPADRPPVAREARLPEVSSPPGRPRASRRRGARTSS